MGGINSTRRADRTTYQTTRADSTSKFDQKDKQDHQPNHRSDRTTNQTTRADNTSKFDQKGKQDHQPNHRSDRTTNQTTRTDRTTNQTTGQTGPPNSTRMADLNQEGRQDHQRQRKGKIRSSNSSRRKFMIRNL